MNAVGSGGFGFAMPGRLILFALVVGWLIPLMAGVWVLDTLYRMRGALERIEPLLRSRGGP